MSKALKTVIAVSLVLLASCGVTNRQILEAHQFNPSESYEIVSLDKYRGTFGNVHGDFFFLGGGHLDGQITTQTVLGFALMIGEEIRIFEWPYSKISFVTKNVGVPTARFSFPRLDHKNGARGPRDLETGSTQEWVKRFGDTVRVEISPELFDREVSRLNIQQAPDLTTTTQKNSDQQIVCTRKADNTIVCPK